MSTIGPNRALHETISPNWTPRNAESIQRAFERVFQELARIGAVSVLPDATEEGSLIQYDTDLGDWDTFAPPSTQQFLRHDGSVLSWALVSLATDVTGTLPVANGGTGLTSYTIGDLLYASGATALSKLADVALGAVLISGGVGAAPAWNTPGTANQVLRIGSGGGSAAFGSINLASSAAVTGSLPIGNGGTTMTSATGGDVIYASGANTWARLAQVTADSFLRSTGLTSGATVVWSTTKWPNAATTGDLLYASAANTFSRLADVATGNAVISGGVGVAPSWGKIGLTTHISGTLPVANGGTGLTTFGGTNTVLFTTAANALASSTALTWDGTIFRINQNAAAPQAALSLTGFHLVGPDGSSVRLLLDTYGTDVPPVFNFRTAYGTAGSPTAIQNGAQLFNISGLAYGATAYSSARVALLASVAENWTDTAQGTYFKWRTTAIGTTVTADKIFIDPNGNLLVDSTTSFPSGTKGLIFGDGTALSGLATNTCGLYGDDVGGTVEQFAINEAGVSSQLTGLQVRKTADESVTNSTTHQADDHLTVQLSASAAYYFEIHGHWTTAGATAGISVQLDGTVGVSSLKADIIIFDHSLNTMSALARVTAFNSAVGAGLTGDNSFLIRGTIETTTAGTLFLEWAQNSADAVNATTLQENSAFVLRRLDA